MRMRVRRASKDQLALPGYTDLLVPPPKSWGADLREVQTGSMTFEKLAKRHRAFFREVAIPWLSRCPANVGIDDLLQEILLEVWQGVLRWDPQYGVPLASYVRLRMRHRMLAYTHRLVKGREKDCRFLTQQIVEEKVVVVHNRRRSGDSVQPTFESVTPCGDKEDTFDIARLVALVVGGLPSKQARLIVGVLFGEQTDSVTQRVYGSKCKRQRKAALRAFAAAAALVESSGGENAEDAQRTQAHHVPFESTTEEAHFAAACYRRATQDQVAASTARACTHAGEGE